MGSKRYEENDMSTVIKNGTVVTADLSYEADVLVEGGTSSIGLRWICCLFHAMFHAAITH